MEKKATDTTLDYSIISRTRSTCTHAFPVAANKVFLAHASLVAALV
jgi:hypothetical protein